jgi:hypothetical protein
MNTKCILSDKLFTSHESLKETPMTTQVESAKQELEGQRAD